MNTQAVQNEILSVLSSADGHPLLQDVLQAQVNSRLRPRPAQADFDDALDNLKRIGFIVCKANDLQPENPYWHLDERGEAYVAKQRL
jgi:hypothetical protein